MARNHSKTLLKTGMISTFLILSLTLVGINFSKITYVAAFVCAAYILNFFTSYWILMTKVLEGKLSDVLKQLISPVCISVVLAAALFLFDHLITIDTNYFVLLVIKGILWLILLVSCLLITGEVKKIKSVF